MLMSRPLTSGFLNRFGWGLIEGFNYYDAARVKEIGPDRAAAEWIVRCEGSVKFDHSPHIVFSDYNALQRFTSELDGRKESDQIHLVAIDATDASISSRGCRHFIGLRLLRDVRFVRCRSLKDSGLEFMVDAASDSLATLHIESCPKITNGGLRQLRKLRVLKSLTLQDLRNVRKPDATLEELKAQLPSGCHVSYTEK